MAMLIYLPEIWSTSKAQMMTLYYALKDLK